MLDCRAKPLLATFRILNVSKDRMSDLEFIQSLAREAGRIQFSRLNSALGIERKVQETNLVTEVDRAIDDLLVTALRGNFPGHAIVSEEGDWQRSTADDVWYVDPLDGTTNYAHAYPVFAVSIARSHLGKVVLGVVYDVSRDELFCVERGAGAFVNGVRLRVSQTAMVARALLSTGFPYDRATNPDNNLEQFARVSRSAQGVRRGGAAALDLAYVAAGRLDGHWERGLGPWDCAAGSLMVEEAGGHLSTDRGGAWSPLSVWTVATNSLIHKELLSLI
jgi:myo-inositol-1(or 4)-monophosphatase